MMLKCKGYRNAKLQLSQLSHPLDQSDPIGPGPCRLCSVPSASTTATHTGLLHYHESTFMLLPLALSQKVDVHASIH